MSQLLHASPHGRSAQPDDVTYASANAQLQRRWRTRHAKLQSNGSTNVRT